MDEGIAVDRLIRRIQEYASGRESDVARGAETPRLAALLVQKYGLGLVDAATDIFETRWAADAVAAAADAATAKIDPSWRENAQQRWTLRPADVAAKALAD